MLGQQLQKAKHQSLTLEPNNRREELLLGKVLDYSESFSQFVSVPLCICSNQTPLVGCLYPM